MTARTYPADAEIITQSSSNRTSKYKVRKDSLWPFHHHSGMTTQPMQPVGDDPREGYDIIWKPINDQALYVDSFPLKRYQSALPPTNNHDPTKDVICLAVLYQQFDHPDSAILVTGSDDKTVRMWNVYETSFIQFIHCPEKATALATYTPSPDNTAIGSKVVICGGNNDKAFALIWDLKTNVHRELFALGNTLHEKYISSVIIHEPSDKSSSMLEKPVLFIGSTDRTVSIWELETETMIFKLPREHTDLLLSIAIHDPGCGRDGLQIITGSWDKTVLFFDYKFALKTYESEKLQDNANSSPPKYYSYKLRGHTKSVTAIAAYNLKGNRKTNNGNHCSVLVTGSLDKTVILWDIETKEKVRTLRGHEQKITAVLIYESKSGSPPIVISGSEDGKSILWDLLSGEKIRELTFPEKVLCQGIVANESGLIIVTGNPKGKTIVTNLCRTERIRKYFTRAVTAVATYTPRPLDPVKDPLVVIGAIDNSCTIFDLTTHKKLKSVENHSSRINAAVIYTPPDPKDHPLVISCDGKAVVVVWDLFTYQRIKEITVHTGAVFCIGLFEPHKCADIRNVDPATLDNAVVNPTNVPLDLTKPILITGGIDRKLIFWDLLAPESTHRLRTIEPDHNGTHSNFIRSLVVHHPITAHEEPLFITGSYDKTAIVWNLRHYTKLYTLSKLHTDYVFFIGLYDPAVQFTGDKKEGMDQDYFRYPSLVTTSYDFSLAVWSLKPDKPTNRPHEISGSEIVSTTYAHGDDSAERAVNNKERESAKYSSDGISRLKYRKIGHRDSVTALSIFVPSNKEDNPLIITGSIDRTVIVWDLFTGSQLQKLIGHTDRVCYITTYLPADGKNPLVFSGSDDETTIVWEDSLYSKPFMPLRDDINRCFDSDCLEEDWPLITEYANTYHARLFLMNSNLFFLAIKYNRPDFLLKFRHFLTLVLPLIRDYNNGQNLLSYAVSRNDLISVRIILLCWTENLNKDINDMLTQRMYHATYFFPDDALKLLAQKYPVEFKHFIISLRLIRNHNSLLLNSNNAPTESAFHILHHDHHSEKIDQTLRHRHRQTPPTTISKQVSEIMNTLYQNANLDQETVQQIGSSLNPINNTRVLRLNPHQRYEVAATNDPDVKFDILWKKTFICQNFRSYLAKQWEEFIYETSDPQPVTSLMIPLRNTAKLKESLELFVKVSNQLDSVDIFNSDVGMISLHYFWSAHAKFFHITAFIQYAILQILFMTALYVFEFYYLTRKLPPADSAMVLVLNGIVLAGFGLYVGEEIAQYGYEQQQLPPSQQWTIRSLLEHFLLNLWNFVDLCIICTAGVGIVLRFIFLDDIPVGRCLLAIGSILMWFKLLYFLRPFSTSGPLVLFCVLAGFTQAFWILSNIDPDLPWGTIKQGFLTSFFYMLGQNISQDMSGTVSPNLATVLIVIFMMVMIILMLNLLIALMGDAFAKVRAKGLAIWRKEQASIISEESFFFAKAAIHVQPYLHVLKYTSEVGNPDDDNVSYQESPLVELVEQGRANVMKFTDFAVEGEEDKHRAHVIVGHLYESMDKKKRKKAKA